MNEMLWYVIVGFVAQMIDGTLGMAYGVSASSLLLTRGIAPAVVSATVHAAEVFTTGVSGVSHHYFGNVDRRLFWRLVKPGVPGAIVGAYVLSQIGGDRFKPFIAVYLLGMGMLIVVRVFRTVPPLSITTHLTPLGFLGAFIDAIGGGGWGPVVASTLIARGNHARVTVGSVNAAEFFVTLAASITFILTMGLTHWPIIAGLAVGGMVAAPLGAYTCKRIPLRPFMFLVGLLVIGLSIRTLIKALI
ncbi:MAG: sulfite exporter TauE/SafE family protein [Candidatus Latescibacterota bacterium]